MKNRSPKETGGFDHFVPWLWGVNFCFTCVSLTATDGSSVCPVSHIGGQIYEHNHPISSQAWGCGDRAQRRIGVPANEHGRADSRGRCPSDVPDPAVPEHRAAVRRRQVLDLPREGDGAMIKGDRNPPKRHGDRPARLYVRAWAVTPGFYADVLASAGQVEKAYGLASEIQVLDNDGWAEGYEAKRS